MDVVCVDGAIVVDGTMYVSDPASVARCDLLNRDVGLANSQIQILRPTKVRDQGCQDDGHVGFRGAKRLHQLVVPCNKLCHGVSPVLVIHTPLNHDRVRVVIQNVMGISRSLLAQGSSALCQINFVRVRMLLLEQSSDYSRVSGSALIAVPDEDDSAKRPVHFCRLAVLGRKRERGEQYEEKDGYLLHGIWEDKLQIRGSQSITAILP